MKLRELLIHFEISRHLNLKKKPLNFFQWCLISSSWQKRGTAFHRGNFPEWWAAGPGVCVPDILAAALWVWKSRLLSDQWVTGCFPGGERLKYMEKAADCSQSSPPKLSSPVFCGPTLSVLPFPGTPATPLCPCLPSPYPVLLWEKVHSVIRGCWMWVCGVPASQTPACAGWWLWKVPVATQECVKLWKHRMRQNTKGQNTYIFKPGKCVWGFPSKTL